MIETNKAFITPDCFLLNKFNQLCFTLHLKVNPKTLGNVIRGSGVGYVPPRYDTRQGASMLFETLFMWKTDLGNIGIDTRSMFISSSQAEQWLYVYFTFFTHCDYRILSSTKKNTVPLQRFYGTFDTSSGVSNYTNSNRFRFCCN